MGVKRLFAGFRAVVLLMSLALALSSGAPCTALAAVSPMGDDPCGAPAPQHRQDDRSSALLTCVALCPAIMPAPSDFAVPPRRATPAKFVIPADRERGVLLEPDYPPPR